MLFDNETIIAVVDTGFDLETVRPGPGEPLHLNVVNDSVVAGVYTGPVAAGDMAIAHGDTQAIAEGGAEPLMTVEVIAGQDQSFHLPASTKRWISMQALPANAAVAIVYPGAAQTNI